MPPTQMPMEVLVVATATPSTDASLGVGCNSVSAVPAGTAVANLLLVAVPLIIAGAVRFKRR